jgi:serine/threonine protein phosphatase PrpC
MDPNIDEFIILASDGLFDKFTSQEAVHFYRVS